MRNFPLIIQWENLIKKKKKSQGRKTGKYSMNGKQANIKWKWGNPIKREWLNFFFFMQFILLNQNNIYIAWVKSLVSLVDTIATRKLLKWEQWLSPGRPLSTGRSVYRGAFVCWAQLLSPGISLLGFMAVAIPWHDFVSFVR